MMRRYMANLTKLETGFGCIHLLCLVVAVGSYTVHGKDHTALLREYQMLHTGFSTYRNEKIGRLFISIA